MIKPLTSLRFIFALMVFSAHCYVIDPHFSHFLYKEGFVGVEFFFVLSGFIIAYNYQEKFNKREVSRKQFWVARFGRVYPLHIATLLLSLFTGGYLLAMNWDGAMVFLSQLFLVHPFVPDEAYFFSYNSPSWSLGCEQLFYLMFPFFALWFNSSRKLFAILIALGTLMFLGMYLTPIEAIKGYWYVNPFTRLPDFLVGILLFRLYQSRPVRKQSTTEATLLEIGAIILFMAFYYFGSAGLLSKVYRYSIYYWLPISAIIYVFARNKGMISRLLSNKYLVIGGDISYAMYLLHLFVFSLYNSLGWSYSWQVVVPLLLVVTVGLSLLSFYYFERPLNRSIRNLYKKK